MFDEHGIRHQTYMTVLQYRSGKFDLSFPDSHSIMYLQHLGMAVEAGRVNVSSDREEYSLTYAVTENQSTVFPGKVKLGPSYNVLCIPFQTKI